jgi:hypothetical protein
MKTEGICLKQKELYKALEHIMFVKSQDIIFIKSNTHGANSEASFSFLMHFILPFKGHFPQQI